MQMATKVIKTIIQFRRDTAANWELKKTVVPAAGEPCYDLDNKILKIGDGVTTYEHLPVVNGADGLNFEDGAQVNKIESISMNGVALVVEEKNIEIPVGGDSLGVVKQSTEITVASDGTLGVGEISFDKITIGEDVVVFDGGDASDYIQ